MAARAGRCERVAECSSGDHEERHLLDHRRKDDCHSCALAEISPRRPPLLRRFLRTAGQLYHVGANVCAIRSPVGGTFSFLDYCHVSKMLSGKATCPKIQSDAAWCTRFCARLVCWRSVLAVSVMLGRGSLLLLALTAPLCRADVEEVTSEAAFKKILSSNAAVAVDFFSQTCGPCIMIAPKFKEVRPRGTPARAHMHG